MNSAFDGSNIDQNNVKKVKQSHYMPGVAQKVLGSYGSQLSKQSAHGGSQPYAPAAFNPRNIPGTHFC